MLTRKVFDDGIALMEGQFGNLSPEKMASYTNLLKDQRDGPFYTACERLAKTFIPRHKGHFPEVGRILAVIEDIKDEEYRSPSSTTSTGPCSYCAEGLLLFKGLWQAEGGWSPDFVRACWCEEGAKRARHWPHGLRIATFEEYRQNETEYADSSAAYLDSLPEDRRRGPLGFGYQNIVETIHALADKVKADDLERERKLARKTEYTEEVPEDDQGIPF